MDHNGLYNGGEPATWRTENHRDRRPGGSGVFVKPAIGVSGVRTRVMGKATRSVHETGSFRELLDLGGAGGCL
jgi:hypothetical protein